MESLQQISIEQALKNLDTVCANVQGDRQTHLVLVGSIAVIQKEIELSASNAITLKKLEDENRQLRERIERFDVPVGINSEPQLDHSNSNSLENNS